MDLISQGRAELVVGRGSFIDAFPLFGFDLNDYDALFAEKVDLLLEIRASERVTWWGKFRPALTDQGVYPRPLQNPLPVWIGAGGTPESFVRAGTLGLPLMVAIIGGEPHRFAPLVQLHGPGRRTGGARTGDAQSRDARTRIRRGNDGRSDRRFLSGYAATFTRVGKERGWPPVTRAQFDAVRAPRGALLVGNPEEVAKKILRHSEALGGLSRVTFQMGVAGLSHAKLLTAIDLIATRV